MKRERLKFVPAKEPEAQIDPIEILVRMVVVAGMVFKLIRTPGKQRRCMGMVRGLECQDGHPTEGQDQHS